MGGKKGFTLIELMVVMSIIAILAVLGVAALLNINNANVVDRASEEIVSALRVAQNKAISVSDASDGSIPVAWGVQVDPVSKTVQPFYVNNDHPISPIQPWEKGVSGLSAMSYKTLDKLEINPSSKNDYYIFSAPFGKYFASVGYPTTWSFSKSRPFDTIPTGASATETTIHIQYRNSEKTITIATNGDVYAK